MSQDSVTTTTNSQVKEGKKKSVLREYAEVIIAAVLLALFIRTFTFQAFKIPSGSMEATLQVGDHIMVNKFLYGIRIPFINKVAIPISNPKRGDVVVFIYPLDKSKDFIKRVIGIAGDKVEIKNKKVFINGKPINDEHAQVDESGSGSFNLEPRDNFGPVTVPDRSIFVMGDNRDHSYDSRFWGFVNLDAMRGKASIIYWSWDSDKWRVRWGRLGNLIR